MVAWPSSDLELRDRQVTRRHWAGQPRVERSSAAVRARHAGWRSERAGDVVDEVLDGMCVKRADSSCLGDPAPPAS
jgi:hypothetical protein